MTAAANLTNDQAQDCGIGEGENCCAYLTMSSKGFVCHQLTALGERLKANVNSGTWSANRLPIGAFPDCQQEARR